MARPNKANLAAHPQALRGAKAESAAVVELVPSALSGRAAALTSAEIAHFNIDDLLATLDPLQGRIWSPWAILLVRFSDDAEPSPPLPKYERLFTSAGSNMLNMVDFFSDMSHGKVDASGTRLFGWYTLPFKRADYVGNVYPQPAGKLNRNGLLDAAKAAAASAGVNLADYAGVTVSGLEHVDLCGWIGGMAALSDSYSLSPSLLGQEMGHGYGLDHARLQGSTADYQDPWDVMSTAVFPAMQAPHPEFGTVGPGLNAWNMRSRGWLDETRVWTAPAPAWDEVVQLRPLHRTDLPGFLAAEIGPYLVEFRVPERWDGAIPRPCVLVHRFESNHSYLMPAYSGSQDLGEGDKFVVGDPNYTIFGYYAAEVTHIDAVNRTATVRLHQRPAHPVPVPGLVGKVLGGVAVDGGGAILVGGRIIKVPPRGPAMDLVEQVARYLEVSISTNGVETALAARRQALAAIVRTAIALHADAEPISEQPPGYQKVSRNGHQ